MSKIKRPVFEICRNSAVTWPPLNVLPISISSRVPQRGSSGKTDILRFADQPLTVARLQVARGWPVIDDGVAPDVLEGVFFFDTAPPFAKITASSASVIDGA